MRRCRFCQQSVVEYNQDHETHCQSRRDLRDRIATAVASSIIGNFMRDTGGYNEEEVADAAYCFADVMLERRNR